ncbi:MAG: hypothetical protein KME46_33560 [Brasilonema angustatum HA4187-MV1]|nr:hypothetical protein [Brasilonema angustatum HA4187-MV1]
MPDLEGATTTFDLMLAAIDLMMDCPISFACSIPVIPLLSGSAACPETPPNNAANGLCACCD